MYQHWADKERDNSSKYSEDVIKMIEMFSEKKKKQFIKKKILLFYPTPAFRPIHHFHPIFPQILPRSTSLNPSIEIDVLMNFINTQHKVSQ